MPEACKFPSLDSCQKRFQWTHKEVDLAPHSVVGLVLQVGDKAKSSETLGLESLDPFQFQNQQAVSMSHTQLKLAREGREGVKESAPYLTRG